jgi:hypothetical protein
MFHTQHYQRLDGLLSADVCQLVFDYVRLRRDTGTMLAPDGRVAGADRLYCDMLTETILARLQTRIEGVVGRRLYPSYSYVRLHGRGASLEPHRDREASEYAVTMAIGGDQVWPIWFKTPGGDVEMALAPGDAVVYEGRALQHWRVPYDGEIQVQCMLFYVAQDGPNASARYDGRKGVGYPWVPPPQKPRRFRYLRNIAKAILGRGL